jgi:Flp pilus assembly protein CpaB
MTYRIRTLGIAIALAVLAGLMTLYYVTSYKQRVDSKQARVPVVVATGDIPAGTTGAQAVAKHLVHVEQMSRGAVAPGAISDPTEISKLVALQSTYAGEQVSARRFGPLAAEGVRSQLTGTFRAVQVAGDPNQVLAGVLKAGDRVDVVANVKFPNEQSQKHFTRVVLRDLLVLRTSGGPSQSTKITNSASSTSWVMLRLTDSQAQKLFFVYTNDDWTLELRPGLDDSDSPSTLADARSVLRAGIGAADANSLAQAEAKTP